ncbi:cupin domain-containing protein [Rubrobacter tropicus]|uniref:Cupin domain-containing protein n=1 Tax=Rubrobacter tropicus TaxID=2653851 RepID=A0A6G8QDR1_9ACTN|nr:cupin domain-containing protein [Rubrobacter tropicus]QIN84593.1 cupin domain-containing protein [Rubrobacter tropicus]
MELKEISADARGRRGTVWTLEGSEDLNANLVRFPSGGGVGEHANEEVDVVMVGIAGHGKVTVNEKEHHLSAGILVFLPKGARRSVRSDSDGFAYLSVHRRRGPVRIDERPEERSKA